MSAPRNQWLAIRLRGGVSNRDAISALVHVVGQSGRDQWNRVTTAVGYGSASDRTVFFGMGQDAAAKSVEISWPSGAKQSFAKLEANHLYVIREGTSTPERAPWPGR